MAGIENSGYNPYALVALKTPKTSGVAPVAGEAPNPVVDTSGDTVVINSANSETSASKNASNLKEILFSNTKIDLASLRKEAASDNPEISSQANKALKSVSEYSYYQYHEAQGADGFIYVAGRGMEPYSNDNGGKYPQKDAVQELADKELTQYLLVSQTMSADSVLKAMQATGKPLTPEQQQKVADLLKEEASNMKPEELAKIKGQLSDAYTSLIPDYPEHDALRKNISALIKNLNKVPTDSINSTWASAINGENTIFELNSIEQQLKNYQPPARSRLFLPEELQLV
jgi:hypothetical protein